MKNKVSMLVLASVVMVAGCSSKGGVYQKMQPETQTQKPGGNTPTPTPKPEVPKDIAGKLAQLPSGTEFNSNSGDVGLKKVGDKWQYTVKDNEQTFAFDVNKMKKGEVFDETEYKKMKHKLNNSDGTSQIVEMDTKLKIAKSDLSYGNYGFLEFLVPFGGKKVKAYESVIFTQKDKEVPFVKPEQDITFSGTTSAILTTREPGNKFSYDNLTGTAKMTIGANQTTGDLIFKYNKWNKTMTVKNVNLENGTVGDVDTWRLSDPNLHFMNREDLKPVWKHKILDNKEIIGGYKVNMQQGTTGYTLDGVFGMKKQ